MSRYDKAIDTTGLASPLPILHAQRVLKQLRSGQVLRVLASGRQVAIDFHDFAKLSGTPLQSRPFEGDQWEYLIQKR